MKDILYYALMIFCLVLIFTCPIWQPVIECRAISWNTKKITKYSIITGCYIEVNSEFVPVENWRKVN